MAIVSQWSERIAARFTPAEADLASEVGAAYAAGGRRRRDLFSRHGALPLGALGPGGTYAEFPRILRALAKVGTSLVSLLRSSRLSSTLHEDVSLAQQLQMAVQTDASENGEVLAIKDAFESLSSRLQSAGFAEPRARDLAYSLLAELLSDAAGAAEFLTELTAIPDPPNRQGPPRLFKRPSGYFEKTVSNSASRPSVAKTRSQRKAHAWWNMLVSILMPADAIRVLRADRVDLEARAYATIEKEVDRVVTTLGPPYPERPAL